MMGYEPPAYDAVNFVLDVWPVDVIPKSLLYDFDFEPLDAYTTGPIIV